MKKIEEQIKAFFSDEKKLKALVNDEEFIGKVLSGETNAETYKEELKKFGLEISTDEARQIENTVNKIFETPTEKIKLGDGFLGDIAGGAPIGNISDNKIQRNSNVDAPRRPLLERALDRRDSWYFCGRMACFRYWVRGSGVCL